MTSAEWRVAVDTGGTFTDCIACSTTSAEVRRAKVLSTSALRCRVAERRGAAVRIAAPWSAPDSFLAGAAWTSLATGLGGEVGASGGDGWLTLRFDAGGVERAVPAPGEALEFRFDLEPPLLAARLALGVPPGRPLPPLDMRLATTRGTNALLERRGARVAWFVTAGFADLLAIGDQRRPDLFARTVRKPAPLYEWVVEVEERLAADGSVLAPLRLEALAVVAERVRAEGAEAAAVALLHSFRNPEHEERVVEVLRRAGFDTVVASAALTPLQRIVPRAETAVVEAYLAPALGDYLRRVAAGLDRRSSLRVMTSAGGLVSPEAFRAKDGLISGPAAGVVGVAAVARRAGLDRVLAFDMGGTSTDATRWNGDLAYRFESRVGDAVVLAPSLEIETVAAGGGSICAFDGECLTVGPRSAGAQPGPACYGAGGPLTLTDVNLLLGRVWPERFEVPLDRAAAETALGSVIARLADSPAPSAVLDGFLAIANERMAGAIRTVSVREGYDPADFDLVPFGGAGGQHACALAELLGIDRVLVPEDASLLSARGLGAARLERFAEEQVLADLDEVAASLPSRWENLTGRAGAWLEREGVPAGRWRVTRRIASLRLRGQEAALQLEAGGGADLAAGFGAAYQALYGYAAPARPLELESLRVVVAEAGDDADELIAAPAADAAAILTASARAWTGTAWADVPLVSRHRVAASGSLLGPALLVERWSAIWVAPGWRAEVTPARDLLLTRR